MRREECSISLCKHMSLVLILVVRPTETQSVVKKLLTVRVVRHCNRLPTVVVDASSLQMFRAEMVKVMSSLD